jgi:hypothetical protein
MNGTTRKKNWFAVKSPPGGMDRGNWEGNPVTMTFSNVKSGDMYAL